MIEIELPDGSIAEFPDGTSNDAIKGALAKRFVAPARPDEKPQVGGGMAGAVDAFGRGVANTATFGFADEIGAGARWLGGKVLPWQSNLSYEDALKEVRGGDNAVAEANPVANAAGMVTGGVGTGLGLAKAGLSGTVNAIKAGKGLAGVSKAAALEGMILGGLQGVGSGEGAAGRAQSAATGGGLGLVAGALLPGVTSAVGGAAKGLAAPLMSRFQPGKYAEKAIGTYLKRSGMTADEVADQLRAARADGQNMFAVADAMGHAGRRALVPAVRTPNDARQELVNQILGRQMGQGERLTGALAEGFAAPQTAKQTVASLTKARDAAANADYGSVRAKVGNDPLWGDDLQKLTSRPSVRQAINDASETAAERGFSVTNPFIKAEDGTLSLPAGTAPNFNFWDNVKRGIDKQISKDPTNGDLVRTKNELLKILDDMVPDYSAAREPFRKASKAIDAVDLGTAAGSARVRAEDSIPSFQAMSPEEQAAFRSGYVDPYISRVEAASMSPGTNKARPLITGKTNREFPAFAAPGMGDQMGQRIAREQRMFETGKDAMGGSATADNFADIDDMANFDPAMMTNLLSGNWKQAAVTGARQALNAGKGLPPRVVERVGRALMETDPSRALATLSSAQRKRMNKEELRALILASILGNTSAGTGRIASP